MPALGVIRPLDEVEDRAARIGRCPAFPQAKYHKLRTVSARLLVTAEYS